MRRTSTDLVHYHHSRFDTLIATAAVARFSPRRPFVITAHGPKLTDLLDRRLTERMTVWALRSFRAMVAVNTEIAERVARAVPSLQVVTVPAYIPPGPEERDRSMLPAPTRAFLETSPGPTAVAAAYRITFLVDGRETYGLDTAVEAFIEARKSKACSRLAIFLADPPTTDDARRYFERLQERAAGAGVADDVLFAVGQPLPPVFDRSIVFLRPTRAEGDSVALREALAAGSRVIASDVVARPVGVSIVPVDDPNAIAAAMANPRAVASESAPDPVEPLHELYLACLRNSDDD